jgi:hypothetical protein
MLLTLAIGFCIHGALDEWNSMDENVEEQIEISVEISEYSQCNNLSLEETSSCLTEYLTGFFNYTIRGDDIKTIKDIKENGGDCFDYNKLYERLGKELGFDTFTFRIKVGEDYHRIAIISDKTGYCLMDQIHKPSCFMRGTHEM